MMNVPSVSYKQLQAFHAVASHGGFTQAAAFLGVTQPAVTVQVRALERERAVMLFERGRAGVRLTEAGQALHTVTRRLFQTLEDCDAVLEAAATLRFGSLRVGLDSPFRAMALVGRFANEHPDVRVQTSMGNAGATLVRLLDGESDVAIFTLVPGERGKLGHLHLIELGHQGVRLLVPRVHALNQGVPVAVKSLANHPFVMREPGSATRATVESLLRQARISPRISFEFGSREAVREAVAAGLGVSLVIEGEEGSDPRLVSVDLADVQSDATLVVACLAERREQPAVRAFLQLVAGDD